MLHSSPLVQFREIWNSFYKGVPIIGSIFVIRPLKHDLTAQTKSEHSKGDPSNQLAAMYDVREIAESRRQLHILSNENCMRNKGLMVVINVTQWTELL